MNDEVVEQRKKECHVYQDTVTLFSVMHEFALEKSISVEIEKDFLAPDGKPRTPDFAFLQGDLITDVIEHKGALPESAQATYDEVMKVFAKYSQLQYNGIMSNPDITVLYPVCADSIVRQVQPRLPTNLTLCCFDQVASDDEIVFSFLTQTKSKQVNGLFGDSPVKYNPTRVRSTYKFIKASPPLIYTAFQVRSQFFIYRDIKSAGQDGYSISREKLLRDALTFLPPWIRNNLQLNSSRVDAALRFLHRIGFLNWQDGDEIRVFLSKGSRSGELIDYFARRLVGATKKEKAKAKVLGRKTTPGRKNIQQSTLIPFE